MTQLFINCKKGTHKHIDYFHRVHWRISNFNVL